MARLLREFVFLENVWALMHKQDSMRKVLLYIVQDRLQNSM